MTQIVEPLARQSGAGDRVLEGMQDVRVVQRRQTLRVLGDDDGVWLCARSFNFNKIEVGSAYYEPEQPDAAILNFGRRGLALISAMTTPFG